MIIYNVLFRGRNVTPMCKAFRNEKEARDYGYRILEYKGLTPKSSMYGNFDYDNASYDIRAEDNEGNSYYIVIFKQTLT